MKFCRDCKHLVGDNGCSSPHNSVKYVDEVKFMVTGIEQPEVDALLSTSCMRLRGERNHPSLGIPLCGPDGDWWEEK